MLAKLGLVGIRFGKEKNGNNNNLQVALGKNNNDKNGTNEILNNNSRTATEGKKSNLISKRPLVSSGRKLNKTALFQE